MRIRRGHRFIRGIDIDLWNEFRKTVTTKKGRARGKWSYLTDELEELLRFYVQRGGHIYTHTDKLAVARAVLRDKKLRNEMIDEEDIEYALDKADVRHERTRATYYAMLCREYNIQQSDESVESRFWSDVQTVELLRKRRQEAQQRQIGQEVA